MSQPLSAPMQVAIILCTYNGASFLREQMDSLLDQRYRNWTCYIFDDCSTDQTQLILKEYVDRYSQHFVLRVNQRNSHSAGKNFIAATENVFLNRRFDLICYCDQDDIWSHDKLTVLVNSFKKVNASLPLLAFSDLSIVDAGLNPVHRSFVETISVGGYTNHIQKRFILVNNIVPGCSLICNRALIKHALPFSKYAQFHDWWLVLVALKWGSLVYVPEQLVLYRQHHGNQIGMPPTSISAKGRRTCRAIVEFYRVYKMVKELYPEERAEVLLSKYIYAKAYKAVCYS